ncbi:7426_t:CDS:2, partial [Gigaspora margarita]
MSAIVTKIVKKYNINSEMSVTDLSRYTSEFLENLTDDRKKNQARRLEDNYRIAKSPKNQVNALFSTQKNESKTINIINSKRQSLLSSKDQTSDETIGDMAQRILRDKLSIRDVRAEAYALALLAKNANAVEATKFPDITKDANKIQRDNQKRAETNHIDYPNEFTLELVKERLDGYNVSTSPDLQALADVMIMLCICPAKLITLHIINAGVTGYTKNRGQPDIPRKFRSIEKDQERAKKLLTWIQNAISSGRMGNSGKPGVKWFNRFLKDYGLIPKYLRKLGAVYAVVVHEAENMTHAYTIAGQALCHNPDNHTSPVQNYIIVNYRPLEEKIPVKALIDTLSKFNIISKSLFDRFEEDYGLEGLSNDELIGEEIKCLDLQFQYKRKWRSLDSTEVIDFQIRKNLSFDLVLGQNWLWMCETKISFGFSSETCSHYAKIVIN